MESRRNVAGQDQVETSGKAIASLVLGLLSFCLSLLAGIPAVLLGIGALREIREEEGKRRGAILAYCGIAFGSLGMLLSLAVGLSFVIPAVSAARTAARVAESSKNLRQIGLGLQNYEDFHKSLPPAGSEDKKIGLGLSWRVRILPFVEQKPLYDKFDCNSPWDSPQNAALIEQMPKVFTTSGVELPPGKTVYLAVTGQAPGDSKDWRLRRTAFNRGKQPLRMHDFVDGTANTIVIVEADPSEAVVWTQPVDWEFEPDTPRRGLGSLRGSGFTALFAEGSAGFVPMTVSDETLRRLFVISDGKPLEDYVPPYYGKNPGKQPAVRKMNR